MGGEVNSNSLLSYLPSNTIGISSTIGNNRKDTNYAGRNIYTVIGY